MCKLYFVQVNMLQFNKCGRWMPTSNISWTLWWVWKQHNSHMREILNNRKLTSKYLECKNVAKKKKKKIFEQLFHTKYINIYSLSSKHIIWSQVWKKILKYGWFFSKNSSNNKKSQFSASSWNHLIEDDFIDTSKI